MSTGKIRSLVRLREWGYAFSHGESENRVGSVGIVVCNPDGGPHLGLSVSAPLDRLTETFKREASDRLRAVAADLGARL